MMAMSNKPASHKQTGLFHRIGAKPIINGVGPATRLGGLPLHSSILEAMADAAAFPTRMDDLQRCAGEELSRLLGVPAAYVTAGAAASLTLATSSLIAGDDIALMDSLPHLSGLRKKVVVLAAHRDPYDRAVEAAGASIDVVGYPHATHLGEVERVLTEETIAVLFRPGRPGNHPSLRALCNLTNHRGIPVIVDGALHAPPVENLHAWIRDGVSLVALSGGKQFRGPQASGILCGVAGLVRRVALHHQDMDEREETWAIGDPDHRTPPRHGIGRSMKVGREQIAGLITAVDRYLASPGADDLPGVDELRRLYELLASSSIHTEWHDTSALSVPVLELAIGKSGFDVDWFARELSSLDVPVFLEESEAWQGILAVNPMALMDGDAEKIAASVEEVAQRFKAADNADVP
jgi:D-glucosaminate-6-phosphate ammonia-lyase